ncbi:MAG TPA: aldehyde dehydrogenase family protein [Blastocatellia bacterium]|nr:aldehyde dehydrogenase family protein [Blastocatellia bacterium]
MASAKSSRLSATKTKSYKNFINGEWVESSLGEYFENRNPANTNEVIGCFPRSGAEDVNKAVAAAKEAYKKWRLVPAPKRAELLFKVGEILMRNKESISRDMTQEMGKVLKETRGDTQEAIDQSFYTAGEGRRLFGYTTPSELRNKFAMCVRQPVGLCALITPWNFPIAIPSWKMIPALVCGNTLVIKPAEDTPLSALHLVEACTEAGIPPGVVNYVSGFGEEAGEALANHSDINLVSFTGSTDVGTMIGANASRQGKRVSLEMGGKNVQIVMEDANIELAVEGALWGAFGTSGQRCTATSRVVVHKKVIKRFTDQLIERAKKLRIGNGLDENIDVGPVINQQAVDKILGYIEIGQKEDRAKLLCGGHRLTKGDLKNGFFIEPTVFGNVSPKMRIATEEIFGPVVSIIPCNSLEEAIDIGNNVKYGLSASIYTQDVNKSFVATRDLYTGIVYVNAPTIGAEVHLPFGGTKATGNGHREAGTQALDIFSEWKSIYVDYSGQLQKAQIDDQPKL